MSKPSTTWSKCTLALGQLSTSYPYSSSNVHCCASFMHVSALMHITIAVTVTSLCNPPLHSLPHLCPHCVFSCDLQFHAPSIICAHPCALSMLTQFGRT